MQKKLCLLICILICDLKICFCGVPALEREISMTVTNEKLNTVLNKIQEQTGLIFSYESTILNEAPAVTLQLKQKTVREALALILPKSIAFKVKNNYIILKEKPVEKPTKKTELSGYVYDKTTEKKLANVTLYDKSTLQTVTTDEYGYYSISLPKEEQCLSVNKENYRDTCVSLTYLNEGPLTNIQIDPVDSEQRVRDSVNWKQKLKDFSRATNDLFKRFKGYINTINVKDTLTRNFQLSVVPFVGTNGLLSGNVYNKYSVNIFGGYARGSKILEIGGFFNVDREKVNGAQIAGFFNLVGDSVQGMQVAGFFNIVGKNMNGTQAAGFLNLNFGTTNGVQIAGFTNINTKSLQGVSVAGMMNLSWHSHKSVEIAGLLNSSRFGENNKQIACLLNNTTKGVTRLQISGFINRAHKVSGLQLGLFNYADSASGVPLGFLSFVKSGLHQLEVSADEVFYTNFSVRTGVKKFHNILSAGVKPGPGDALWHFGYGIGTSIKLKNKLNGDLSASMHHVNSGKFYFATSELYKFYLGLEYKFTNKFAISAGATYNLYWSDALSPEYETTYNKIVPYYSSNKSLPNDFNLKGWFGGKVALRFF